MNRSIKITIPDKPIPNARPRKGRYGNIYNSQKDIMKLITGKIHKQLPENWSIIPSKTPIFINILFTFKPTESEKKIARQVESKTLIPYCKKPDIDNLFKLPIDCMEGLLYENDNQIFGVNMSKCYAGKDETQIEIIWNEVNNESEKN